MIEKRESVANVPGDAVNSMLIRHVMANEIRMHALQNFMRALLIFILIWNSMADEATVPNSSCKVLVGLSNESHENHTRNTTL